MRCSTCKTTENLMIFMTYESVKRGRINYYRCRSCNNAKWAKYMATKAGKYAKLKANRKYNKNNKLRKSAWEAAQIVTQQPCEVCGDKQTHRHHHDPSDKLNVTFLCPLHHRQAHGRGTKA